MDNSLGLDVTGTTDAPQPDPVPKGDDEPASPAPPTPAGATPKSPPIDKKVPYVNKNRVQTGGAPRVRVLFLPTSHTLAHCPLQEKLSPEELEARMAEIRKRNQQIKEKREVRFVRAQSSRPIAYARPSARARR